MEREAIPEKPHQTKSIAKTMGFTVKGINKMEKDVPKRQEELIPFQ